MALEFTTSYLEDSLTLFRYYKKLAEGAMAQVSDEELVTILDGEMNSIALIVKHIAGNMRSRWTDFLTTDGEKADRNRDSEFEIEAEDSRSSLLDRWEDGWRRLLDAVGGLGPEDLLRTVTIRGEAHTVLQAIQRQLTHYAYHVGQIVFLARHFAGEGWTSLSIPKGRSRDFDVARNGRPYRTASEESR